MKILLLAVAGCILTPLGLRAETIEIIASADTTLRENAPAGNSGGAPNLRVGTDREMWQSRTLLRFDVAAALPPGATVTAARLVLEPADQSREGAAPETFELRRVRDFWNEGDGQGGAAEPQEATWQSRAHPQLRWTRPGGARAFDFAKVPSATSTVVSTGACTFDSTPELVADVQHALDHPQRHEGWMMTRASGTGANGVRTFAAREDTARAPRLTVEFTPAPRISSRRWNTRSSSAQHGAQRRIRAISLPAPTGPDSWAGCMALRSHFGDAAPPPLAVFKISPSWDRKARCSMR
jgi:hypothetical protein